MKENKTNSPESDALFDGFQEIKMVLHCCTLFSNTLCAAILLTQAAEDPFRLS